MARKPRDHEDGKDGSLRIRPAVLSLLVALEEVIQQKSAGDKVSRSDIIFAALKLLAKEISPELLPQATGAELLAAAVQKVPSAPDQPGGAPRSGGSGPASAGR